MVGPKHADLAIPCSREHYPNVSRGTHASPRFRPARGVESARARGAGARRRAARPRAGPRRRPLVRGAAHSRAHHAPALPGARLRHHALRRRGDGRTDGQQPALPPPRSPPARPPAAAAWSCRRGAFSPGRSTCRAASNLHVADGATLAFATDPARVPAACVHALGRHGADGLLAAHLRLRAGERRHHRRGHARRAGRRDHWWPWKGGARTRASGDCEQQPRATADGDGRRAACPCAERVFGEGCYLRPQFVQPYRCRNVLIEGVTIINSPMWEIHPVLCNNVTVRGVTDRDPRAEQRRLQPRVVPRRAHRGLHLRHGRRLHRDQVRPQRRRPPHRRAEREHRRPRLHDEGRPRRRRPRQRDLGRRAQRVRRAVPDGQPEPRPRAPLQDQRDARRRASSTSTCAT